VSAVLLPPASAAADPTTEGRAVLGGLSQWQLIVRRFKRHKLALASLFVLAFLYLMGLMAEAVAPYTSDQRHLDHAYAPPQALRWSWQHGLHVRALVQHTDPISFRKSYTESAVPVPLRWGAALSAGDEPVALWGLLPLHRRLLAIDRAAWQQLSTTSPQPVAATFFLLGADKYGRDIFSRAVYGARISLSVGLVGIVLTFVLGMTIGGISGYVGGRTDNIIQRGIEILQAFPQLPLWIALAAVLPGDWSALKVYFAITLLLGLLNWTGLARVVRGKILSLREEDYAVAARLLGASHARVLFRHLMPGFTSHIIVALTLSVPGMILGETALSFLGLGLRPPIVSWGVMLQDCLDVKAVSYYPWLLMPVGFIVSVVLCFNFLGDGLRDAADPYGN